MTWGDVIWRGTTTILIMMTTDDRRPTTTTWGADNKNDEDKMMWRAELNSISGDLKWYEIQWRSRGPWRWLVRSSWIMTSTRSWLQQELRRRPAFLFAEEPQLETKKAKTIRGGEEGNVEQRQRRRLLIYDDSWNLVRRALGGKSTPYQLFKGLLRI